MAQRSIISFGALHTYSKVHPPPRPLPFAPSWLAVLLRLATTTLPRVTSSISFLASQYRYRASFPRSEALTERR